jgi:hypothetical protein
MFVSTGDMDLKGTVVDVREVFKHFGMKPISEAVRKRCTVSLQNLILL